MDLSTPGSDIVGRTRALVLLALARVTEPVSGREVARLAGGVAASSAHRELQALVQTGLVGAKRSSHATTYALNREHVLWPPLFEIFASPAKVEQRIGELISQGLGTTTACALFGSVARGDATAESDIDVLVVTDDVDSERLEDALDRVRDDLASFTGNTPQVVTVTRSQLRRMVKADDPLIDSWERDARTISGPDVRGLIRKARLIDGMEGELRGPSR